MINFFRRIRHKLIQESQFFKYLKYAVGEIILVVLGILIALQINNWNEDRINRDRETKILKEIREDLLQTENKFQETIINMQETIEGKKAIIKTIDEDLIWNDTLQDHLNKFWELKPEYITTTSYETLKGWGMSNIENDSLRKDIIEVFESGVEYCDLLNESQSKVHWGTSYHNDFQLLYDFTDYQNIRIYSYEKFLEAEDYAKRERIYLGTLKLVLKGRKYLKEWVTRVRKNIETELGSR